MAKKKVAAAEPPSLAREDLVIIHNALNEICNGVDFDDDEFETRIGYTRAQAAKVLKKIGKLLTAAK